MTATAPFPPETLPPVAGVILAGGRGSRMGGVDKALIPLGGRALADHVRDRLAPQVAALAISANGDPGRFSGTVLPDPLPDQPGPLAGVLAAMDWAGGLGFGHVVTVSTDTPFLPRDLVRRLWAGGSGGPAIAATETAPGVLRAHPTFGLWPVDLAADLRETLARGDRKVMLWAERQGATLVPFATGPVDPFFNINTPDDLARAERLLPICPQA